MIKGLKIITPTNFSQSSRHQIIVIRWEIKAQFVLLEDEARIKKRKVEKLLTICQNLSNMMLHRILRHKACSMLTLFFVLACEQRQTTDKNLPFTDFIEFWHCVIYHSNETFLITNEFFKQWFNTNYIFIYLKLFWWTKISIWNGWKKYVHFSRCHSLILSLYYIFWFFWVHTFNMFIYANV